MPTLPVPVESPSLVGLTQARHLASVNVLFLFLLDSALPTPPEGAFLSPV